MSLDDLFHCSLENRVALITIDRPPLNVLAGEHYHHLCNIVLGLIERREARAVIITGTTSAFISGLDINDIRAIKTAEENNRFTSGIKAIFRRIEKAPRPVIAAINGNCFGGGLELALSCHMRLASSEARLGLPEIKLGTIPSFGGTQRLPRIVGRAKSLELVLTGRTISGVEALGIGLVNAVYSSGELIDRARDLAGQIAEKNYQAVDAAIRVTTEGLEMEFDKGIAHESAVSSELTGTHNMKEGMAAFFERRKPVFKDEQ
jgi:enoyl-CoA hydratase